MIPLGVYIPPPAGSAGFPCEGCLSSFEPASAAGSGPAGPLSPTWQICQTAGRCWTWKEEKKWKPTVWRRSEKKPTKCRGEHRGGNEAERLLLGREAEVRTRGRAPGGWCERSVQTAGWTWWSAIAHGRGTASALGSPATTRSWFGASATTARDTKELTSSSNNNINNNIYNNNDNNDLVF